MMYIESDMREGERMRFCELRDKDVINACDCKCLGSVVDIIVDMKDGCLEAIIVPGPGQIWGLFGNDSEFIIPFECIRKVGPDIILVEIKEEKCLRKRKP